MLFLRVELFLGGDFEANLFSPFVAPAPGMGDSEELGGRSCSSLRFQCLHFYSQYY